MPPLRELIQLRIIAQDSRGDPRLLPDACKRKKEKIHQSGAYNDGCFPRALPEQLMLTVAFDFVPGH